MAFWIIGYLFLTAFARVVRDKQAFDGRYRYVEGKQTLSSIRMVLSRLGVDKKLDIEMSDVMYAIVERRVAGIEADSGRATVVLTALKEHEAKRGTVDERW